MRNIEKFRLWLQAIDEKWGDVIQFTIGVVVVSLCTALIFLALEIRDSSQKTDALGQNTAEQSYIACIRTKKFAPDLAKFYKLNRVMSADNLKVFISTIPADCPKP